MGPSNDAIAELVYYQNYALSQTFETRKEQYRPHVDNSRGMMLSQAEWLNPKSKVIVMGPGPLEPLAELAALCGELVLLNYDATSLDVISTNLSRNNVTIKKMDFTGGLYDRLEELLQRADHENWDPLKLIDEATSLFTTYKTSKLFKDPNLRNADYVISSLVATQFTVFSEQRLEIFFEEKYGMKLEEYLKSRTETDRRLSEADLRLTNYLFVKYGKKLARLIKPTGRIYLSDTVSMGKIVSHPANPTLKYVCRTVPLDLTNFNRIVCDFQILESKRWFWYSRPSDQSGFEVQAYLLTKNK